MSLNRRDNVRIFVFKNISVIPLKHAVLAFRRKAKFFDKMPQISLPQGPFAHCNILQGLKMCIQIRAEDVRKKGCHKTLQSLRIFPLHFQIQFFKPFDCDTPDCGTCPL